MTTKAKSKKSRPRARLVDRTFVAEVVRVLEIQERRILRLSKPRRNEAMELFRQADLEKVVDDTRGEIAKLLKTRHQEAFANRTGTTTGG